MNICILSHRYPYKDHMVHVFVKKLVDEWALMGHHCVVISPLSVIHLWLGKERNAPVYEKQFISNNVYVDVYRPRYVSVPLKIKGVNIGSYLHQKTIEKTIKKTHINFDFIYGHFFETAILGWQYAKTNSIPLFMATGESSLTNIDKPCSDFSFEKFRQDITGAIAVSSKNKNEAINKGWLNEKNVRVFPNGTNLMKFNRMPRELCRKELGLPSDVFIITCVGQFVERKGQKRILQALDIINNPQIKTVFIGKGEDVLNHNSILFKGSVKNSLLPLYLNATDVFVLPTQNEGCCNAIIEALACGCTIISSDKDFNHDVLNTDNSILINPDKVEEIATAILSVYGNSDLRLRLGEAAYKTGLSLSIEKRAKNIIDFIQKNINEYHKEE